MKISNLCIFLRDGEILLALKKRGFGAGKWNGVGGKPETGEPMLTAAVREIREEIEVETQEQDLELVGRLKFYFPAKPEWDQGVVIYVCRRWQGEPTETEEMRPQWYRFSEIPFDKMWPDDKFWLPKLLAGEKFEGEFIFTSDNERVQSHKLIKIL